MKNKYLFIIILIFTLFCFFVLLKGLSRDSSYIPDVNFGKKLTSFEARKFSNNQLVNSNELFDENKTYVLNIWASWCVPCRVEHSTLMKLKENKSIKIIGINYKDNLINAKKFIDKYGNPYSEILIDNDGTIAISLGAYGIPETIIVDKDKTILKKFIGVIDNKSLKEIESLIK
tara:strand:- start:522 stop:1043 length:522 start_codon:yes stop_codon:yes gene_type:complete